LKRKVVSGIMLTLLLIGMLALAFNIQPVKAVDWWPMFHHDLNHTGYSTSTAPNTNNTVWSYTTGGNVASSPAVVDGVVFIGSNDGKVYALNVYTGAHIWNYTTGSVAWSSPAVADGKVYVGSWDSKVYCLDASTGTHIWNYTTGREVLSSPAVAYGKVYVGSGDNNVYCLNASTGTSIWIYPTVGGPNRRLESSPAVVDGKVYIGSDDHKVYAFGSPPSSVGGIWIPIDKFGLLIPYIELTSLLAVAVVAVVYVKKRKRDTGIIS